jgi:two-component system response regulator YesN
MKILIVEDEINTREGLAELITRINPQYQVCGKAADGEDGARLTQILQPDLIFVDIQMPKLGGLDMIENVMQSGVNPCFVILSGHADFKFAQRSIKLGVTEYLLKPITYNDLTSVLREMETKIRGKKQRSNDTAESLTQDEILKTIMLQTKGEAETAFTILTSSISEQENMFLINLYLGQKSTEELDRIIEAVTLFKNQYHFTACCYSLLEQYRFFTIFINTSSSFQDMLKRIKYNLVFSLRQNGFNDIVASLLYINDSLELNGALAKLQWLSRWSIVLGSHEVIHEDLMRKVKSNHCTYPQFIENEALAAVKNNNFIRLFQVNADFIAYLSMQVHDPDQIIEVCNSYVFSILMFLRGCNSNLYYRIKNNGILEVMRNSYTMAELKNCLDNLVKQIQEYSMNDVAACSLLVRKTVNYIKEHYTGRISLEEIAQGMSVTPEYVSHLFTKEMGKNFSHYVREFRINIAKRLIMDSGLKLYEVGEQVGYKDPKYFYKMFKDVTGLAPKDYLIMHKK